MARGRVERRNFIECETLRGFHASAAGVTPAPSERKIKMRDFVPVRSFLRSKDHGSGAALAVAFCSPFPAGKGVRGIGRGGIVASSPVPLPTMGRG